MRILKTPIPNIGLMPMYGMEVTSLRILNLLTLIKPDRSEITENFSISQYHTYQIVKKHSVNPMTIQLHQLRENDRQVVTRIKNRIKQGDTALTTYTDPEGDPFVSWYKMAKHIPLRLVDNNVQPAIFENNQELIDKYWEESLDTLQGFFDCKCLELMPEDYVPDLSGILTFSL